MAQLFSKLKLRGIEFKNRIFVSPMCQYSSIDGAPNAWHMVHLGSRAVGGAGLVMVEASAVSPEGRISLNDSGIWSMEQVEAFRPVVRFIKEQNAVAAIQIAHAGRKASSDVPWRGGHPLNPDNEGWQPQGPSSLPFTKDYPTPHALTPNEIDVVLRQFIDSALLARQAGFDVIEVHMAHGYLLHEFLSPLSNKRIDKYGGNLENRMRLPVLVAQGVREVWPADLPVFVRISATDWAEGGWDLEQSIQLVRRLKEIGVDLVDCSSGGTVADAKIPAGPGYQVPFAAAIRAQVGMATGAVGIITEPVQAEQIIATGQADAVLLARELLRDPYWPLHAASRLNVDVPWPQQYLRAKR